MVRKKTRVAPYHIRQSLLLGLLTSILGMTVYFLFSGLELEESVALDALFLNRGAVTAPDEVVIVAIDKESSDHLDLPNHPRDWPRKLHTQLIKRLKQAGAKVIVFDIFFQKPKIAKQDINLSLAIRQAGNVILFEHSKRDIVSMNPDQNLPGLDSQAINIETTVPPLGLIGKYARAQGPFSLPKYPLKVSRFWTFRVPAGDVPNLPVLALQLYTLGSTSTLFELMEQALPGVLGEIPKDAIKAEQQVGLRDLTMQLRKLFQDNPTLSVSLPELLRQRNDTSTEERRNIQALINLYAGSNRYYLNYYGPPRTIKTLAYYRVLESTQLPDLTGKVVFVGFSERLQPEQKDNFYTVFSQRDGLDLSGVEIGATAFANLLHSSTLTTPAVESYLGMIILFGFVIAFSSRLFSTVVAVTSTLLLTAVWVYASTWLFSTQHYWLPVAVPLLIQMPMALFTGLLWHYRDSRRERDRIRNVFGHYLPESVVDQVVDNTYVDMNSNNRVMYGICLATDATQYTRLAETMPAATVSRLMNHYYELLFTPVRNHDGIISDVIGDAMLALWTAPMIDRDLRSKACRAALDIHTNIEQARRAHSEYALPTRIGLHAGELVIGNVGAVDHYEYRAVGDIVNTANRIQGLNKQLGTRLMASSAVVDLVDCIHYRELGDYRMAGKRNAVSLVEILCLQQELTAAIEDRSQRFNEAALKFKAGDWDGAHKAFEKLSREDASDGPSLFYLRLCKQYSERQEIDNWDGIIIINEK
ncbi:MAG TPA: adenylate/guanylate cyclase domain-containing protein [Gammaproteobacteria bacterium]|nr:adenylate/guanylate cyclase domain-containing protein [Gammaproteobacteria bacterium]